MLRFGFYRNLLDPYSHQFKDNTFKFPEKTSIIPNPLGISYALAISNSGNAKKIFLAGFDGYEEHDSRSIEMNKMFSIYV